MTIKERIAHDYQAALKARDERQLSAMRMIRTEAKKREVSGQKKELSDAEVLEVISSLVKQRRESIRLFAEGKRQDLVEKEEAELKVLLSYLPQPLSSAELEDLINQGVQEIQAVGPKDQGKVMKWIIPKVSGRADGKAVSEMVKQKLAQMAS
jgi:uncharacterized protein YqeY